LTQIYMLTKEPPWIDFTGSDYTWLADDSLGSTEQRHANVISVIANNAYNSQQDVKAAVKTRQIRRYMGYTA
jgi:hypothetical protein